MNPKAIIETCGTIRKKEILQSCLKCQSEYLIMEPKVAYPGYYGRVPGDTPPRHHYLLLKSNVNEEILNKVSQKIKSESEMDFDAAFGKIMFQSEYFHAIRIKEVDEIEQMNKIINLYQTEGIDFVRLSKDVPAMEALIEIKKFFYLEEYDNDVFIEKVYKSNGYFIVPHEVKWDDFERLIKALKNNFSEFLFDAATGTIFRKAKLRDIVRIYSAQLDYENLLKIKERYLYFLDRGKY